jgi:hypothetical protein
MVAGRRRWVERMRLLKARGLIAKFPSGRKPRGAKRRSSNRTIARAQRAIEEIMMAKTTMPAPLAEQPAPAPWAKKPKGERLSDVVDMGLEQVRRVLEKELDPNDCSPAGVKLLSIVTNAALTVLSLQLRLDEAALRTSSQTDFDYAEFYQRFGTEDGGDKA